MPYGEDESQGSCIAEPGLKLCSPICCSPKCCYAYRKHTGERPFRCHCGKAFSRLDNLRQHAQTVHADMPERNESMMQELVALHTSLAASAAQMQHAHAQVIGKASASPSTTPPAPSGKKGKAAKGAAASKQQASPRPRPERQNSSQSQHVPDVAAAHQQHFQQPQPVHLEHYPQLSPHMSSGPSSHMQTMQRPQLLPPQQVQAAPQQIQTGAYNYATPYSNYSGFETNSLAYAFSPSSETHSIHGSSDYAMPSTSQVSMAPSYSAAPEGFYYDHLGQHSFAQSTGMPTSAPLTSPPVSSTSTFQPGVMSNFHPAAYGQFGRTSSTSEGQLSQGQLHGSQDFQNDEPPPKRMRVKEEETNGFNEQSSSLYAAGVFQRDDGPTRTQFSDNSFGYAHSLDQIPHSNTGYGTMPSPARTSSYQSTLSAHLQMRMPSAAKPIQPQRPPSPAPPGSSHGPPPGSSHGPPPGSSHGPPATPTDRPVLPPLTSIVPGSSGGAGASRPGTAQSAGPSAASASGPPSSLGVGPRFSTEGSGGQALPTLPSIEEHLLDSSSALSDERRPYTSPASGLADGPLTQHLKPSLSSSLRTPKRGSALDPPSGVLPVLNRPVTSAASSLSRRLPSRSGLSSITASRPMAEPTRPFSSSGAGMPAPPPGLAHRLNTDGSELRTSPPTTSPFMFQPPPLPRETSNSSTSTSTSAGPGPGLLPPFARPVSARSASGGLPGERFARFSLKTATNRRSTSNGAELDNEDARARPFTSGDVVPSPRFGSGSSAGAGASGGGQASASDVQQRLEEQAEQEERAALASHSRRVSIASLCDMSPDSRPATSGGLGLGGSAGLGAFSFRPRTEADGSGSGFGSGSSAVGGGVAGAGSGSGGSGGAGETFYAGLEDAGPNRQSRSRRNSLSAPPDLKLPPLGAHQ